ncbi:MAG: fluoride efflux transporter CrcB [Gemmatimonadota bacterium]|jgi:CrcB protein
MVVFWVALGGAIGASARYGVGGWVHARLGSDFPWGTLVVNVAGSLLIGFALRYLEATRLSPDMRALITIGVLGAFTTFSTFSYETVTLLEGGAWMRAFTYATGSFVLGLAAAGAGITMARHLLQVHP